MGEVIPFPTKQTDDPDDYEEMVVITVYGSGRVTCWLSNDVETDEQYDWAARVAGHGIDAIKEMKEEKDD